MAPSSFPEPVRSARERAPRSDVPLGIVIPALNEEEALPRLLEDLRRLPLPHRIVVVDGGSSDRTREACAADDVTLVPSAPGRARQMRAGVRRLDTEWILFLHADSRMPAPTRQALARWLSDPPPEEAGHFRFRLDAEGAWWSALERGQRVRERLTGLAYGDQGLLISRSRLEEVGGVPDLPLMEDVELIRRLRRTGGVDRIPAPLVTSARRYREEGPFLGWVRNAALILLYAAGVPATRLARWYRPRRGSDAAPRRVLLVFAKAPRPGEVKTRLAEELGREGAARLYRRIGRLVLEGVHRGPYRPVVCYDPPGSEDEVRRWLEGLDGLEYRPQEGGGLGERLDEAFRWAFGEAGAARVVVVGTDAPELDGALVEEAFQVLDGPHGPDLVIGPAVDGGYYLLGLRDPAPDLFRDIPWSTDRVLDRTLDRARGAGLAWELLPTLRDVDRPEDIPAGLRSPAEPA